MLYALAHHCLVLRDCVSLFSRVEISDDEVSKLEKLCQEYHKVNILYFAAHQTAWTLAHVVPSHTKDMKTKYDKGLGLNSMEGREAKHVFISRYNQNTSYQLRWQQIFRHEYISLIWLRERHHNIFKPSSCNRVSYIPKRAIENPNYCYCGFPKTPAQGQCTFCVHPLRIAIDTKVKTI